MSTAESVYFGYIDFAKRGFLAEALKLVTSEMDQGVTLDYDDLKRLGRRGLEKFFSIGECKVFFA